MVWPIETLIGPGDLSAEATKALVRHGADRRVAWAEVLGCPPAIFVLHITPNRAVSAAGCDASRA
jgi:hypothetical protein